MENNENLVNSAVDIARNLNYRMHAEQLNIPVLNGLQVIEDKNPQIIMVATGGGYTEQLVSDGYIADGEFEKRIEDVIATTKKWMESNHFENVGNSFIKYKDYSNGVFNYKLYVQDMIIPDANGKKVIRMMIAYFVEPKMHDFYQASLSVGPLPMPTEKLKVGVIDLEHDEITAILDKAFTIYLNNLKYKN